METLLEAPATTASSARRADRRWLGVAGAVVLIALMARPMVIGRTFVGWDWYVHQWYIWHQSESIKAHILPTLFAHDPTAVFAPHFAFYGGTLYALAGALTVLTGDAGSSMVIILVLGFAAAYGGWYWLARQAGLSTWLAHAPAVLFITGPYYLATIYATGGFGEFTAISMIPLMLASGSALLAVSRGRQRLVATALLAIGVVLFTGSHNITLLWGSTVLLVVGGVLIATIPGLRRRFTRAGLLRVAAVVVPAVMVNGWFLLPDVVYQSHTIIASWNWLAERDLHGTMFQVADSKIFSPGRGTSLSTVPHFSLQLPVLGLAWVLGGLVLLRTRWQTPWFRAIVVLLMAIVPLFVLMKSFSLLWGLPKPYNNIQFSYRLESYIFLAFAGAVLGVLVLLRRGTRSRAIWVGVLCVVAAWSVGGAVYQLRQQPPSKESIWRTAAPYYPKAGVPNPWDYGSNDLPVMDTTGGLPQALFSPVEAQAHNHAEAVAVASPGALVQTNLVTMPQLVHLEGARFAGRANTGQAIIEIDEDATPGAAKVSIGVAHPWPVVGGWILTLLGLAGLAANGFVLVRAARRQPGAGR